MTSQFTRRDFVRLSSLTALSTGASRTAGATLANRLPSQTQRLVGLTDAPLGQLLDPAGVRLLAERAIEAARAAGASYADVRLTRTIKEAFSGESLQARYTSTIWGGERLGVHDKAPTDDEAFGVGVRALVDGCWGFASSSRWTFEEMPRLAQAAVQQAKKNAAATPRRTELVPVAATTGSWRPAEVIDPFLIAPEEKLEHLRALTDYLVPKRIPPRPSEERKWAAKFEFAFTRQEWALATSEGTYCTQQRYTSNGDITLGVMMSRMGGYGGESMSAGWPGLMAQGWEYCERTAALARLDAAVELYYHPDPGLAVATPVEVGRYTVVCAAPVVSQLVAETLGQPTELDRALGYEANAGGTSWLNDPLDMVGNLRLGSPLLTVTGNRSAPSHLATVRWDDEGVEPDEVPLVKEGMLQDFQTTRESASWLASYYNSQGRPVRSHGCAGSDTALSIPMAHPPNLVMQPGTTEVSFEELIRDVKKGIAIQDAQLRMDFQGKNGLCIGEKMKVREIIDGQLGAVIIDSGLLFEASELWKNLVATGGPASTVSRAAMSEKGQPAQSTAYTVSAVPVTIKNATIVDIKRRS